VLPGIPKEIDQNAETITYVLIDGELAGFITLADTIRETAAEAIAKLKEMNIKSYLLTAIMI
jgi:Cu2+-exporting ATPase